MRRSNYLFAIVVAAAILLCNTVSTKGATTPTPTPVPTPATTLTTTTLTTALPTPTPVPTTAIVPTPTTAIVPTPTPTPTPAPVKIVDLVIFAGQSNMSGKGGNAMQAPRVAANTGYEFRIGTCPTGMYPMSEPFGVYSTGYLSDLPALRGGSLASAFMNAYYKGCKVPVLGFSASCGGSSINYWQSAPVQAELTNKYNVINTWCAANNVLIRKRYVVWLQGETDGVANIDKDTYKRGLVKTFSTLFSKGLDQVFVIPIGQYVGLPGTYDKIRLADMELCASDARFTLGSDALGQLPASYIPDGCHYNQAALIMAGNECGNVAALRSTLIP